MSSDAAKVLDKRMGQIQLAYDRSRRLGRAAINPLVLVVTELSPRLSSFRALGMNRSLLC